MKSLSKGNSSKKDPFSSSSNLRDSTAFPSSLSPEDTFEDELSYVPSEKNRFGWSKQVEREPSPPINVDRVPSSSRMGGNLATSVYLDSQWGQRGGQNDKAENEADYLKPTTFEQDRTRKTSKKVGTNRLATVEDKKIDSHVKRMDLPKANDPDDDLNALLKVLKFWTCYMIKIFFFVELAIDGSFAWLSTY